MYIPTVKTDSMTLSYVYGTHFLSQLSIREETKALYDEFKPHHDELASLVSARFGAWSEYHQAMANRDNLREDLHDELRQFHFSLLRKVGGNRTVSLYRQVIGEKLGNTAVSMEKMIARVEKILRSVETLEHDGLVDMAVPLETAFTAWKKAMAEAEAKKIAYRGAYEAEYAGRTRWINAYRKMGARLILIYGEDRRMIRKFFKKRVKRSDELVVKPKEEEVEPVEVSSSSDATTAE